MLGGMAGSICSLFLGSTNHAPWGGLIVLPVVGNRIGYFVSIVLGTVITALAVSVLKKNVTEEENKTESVTDNNDGYDLNIEF